MPFTNAVYCSYSGLSRPRRCRLASITCGVQALPQVSLAGSAGRALNSKNVIMLSAMSIKTIATSRRMM